MPEKTAGFLDRASAQRLFEAGQAATRELTWFRETTSCSPVAFEVYCAMCLDADGAITPAAANERAGVPAFGFSRAIAELENAGLAHSGIDPRDKRHILAAFTPRGRAMAAGMEKRDASATELSRFFRTAHERNLTALQLEAYASLAAFGEADVTTTARRCGMPRSSASFSLKRLEARGLAQRTANRDCRKAVYACAQEIG